MVRKPLVALLALQLCGSLATPVSAASKSQNYTLQGAGFGPISILPITSLGPPQVINNGPTIKRLSDSDAELYWKTSQEANAIVEYGTTPNYGTETGKFSSYTTDHNVALAGLKPETTYFFRVKSVNVEGLEGVAPGGTFTTLSARGITGITVSDVTYDSALVRWQTGGATKSEVQYGGTTSYGSSVADTSLSYTTNHTVKLERLDPGTSYHFRVVATSQDGTVDRSSDLSFTTVSEPKITKFEITPTTPHDASIAWATNVPTSAILTLRKAKDGKDVSQGFSDLKPEYSLTVPELLDNTEYIARLVVTDGNGRQVKTDEKSFTMPQDKEAPKITNLKVSMTRSGDDIVMTATWKTNKLSTGKGTVALKSSQGKGKTVNPEPSPVLDHILVKTGLSPSSLYVLKVQSTDIQGNVGEAEISFITPAVRKSIFSMILDSFSQTFGWISTMMGK